jgi:sugar phosphate isomerase/epimerase
MKITRRTALQAGPAAVAGLLGAAPSPAAEAPGPRRTRLAVSTYSYWHFQGPKYPIDKVIETAARIGFDGVEVLHRQMAEETPAYLNRLKRLAFANGLDLVMLSIHQDFVSPKEEERRKHIDHTKHCIDLAQQMGIPAIRLNSGRWKTVKSFDELMKLKGDEPPLAGYTNDDAFAWCIDSIEQCLPAAEKAGVVLALENHWGLTTSIEGVLRIRKAIASPWLGVTLDCGNFPGEPYPQIERLASYATVVHAKTYHGGGVWYTLDLDYQRIAKILRAANFSGYVSLEMEGNEDASTAVPKSLALLRAAFG